MWLVFCLFLAQSTVTRLPEMSKEEAIAIAKETLSQERDVDEGRIQVRRADAVRWPDTRLGCPQEGETFTEIITPGYRVLLQAEGALYRVHVGGGSAVVCGGGLQTWETMKPGEVIHAEVKEEPSIPTPSNPALQQMVTQAKTDLAERLDINRGQIDLLELKEVVWPDTSLGCPRPGMAYPQVTRDGHLIRLRAGKRTYEYHSGQSRAPFLCEHPAKR